MLRLSINLLSNAIRLLSNIDFICNSMSNSIRKDYLAYNRSYSVDFDTLFDMSKICCWISEDNNNISLTSRGYSILSDGSSDLSINKLRLMLEDYIIRVKPIWINRIPYGRQEASIIMNKDERACFQEAGLLFNPPTNEVIIWWDKISNYIRTKKQDQLSVIGRTGEKLTLSYEQKRTAVKANWVSIDSNLVGYDIISQLSEIDTTRMLIEVKASSDSIDYACFHVSRNEWHVAKSSKNYYFYLWLISPKNNYLAILSSFSIGEHIPVDSQDGEWESVAIPFKVFSSQFIEVH